MAHARLIHGVAAAIALALGAVGCGEASAPATPPRPSATPVAPPPAMEFEAGWGDYRSKRFDLALPLPDAHGWSIDDTTQPWLVATHAASGSTLVVRVWHEADVVNRERCETRAREWRKLPGRDGADILRKDRVGRPVDFDTVVEVGVVAPPVRPGAPVAPLEGFAMAYGGWLHKCFAWVYSTRASGAGAERRVGARLAAMTDGSLGGVELDSELSPRIPREPIGPSRP